jgi:hypothetical protein
VSKKSKTQPSHALTDPAVTSQDQQLHNFGYERALALDGLKAVNDSWNNSACHTDLYMHVRGQETLISSQGVPAQSVLQALEYLGEWRDALAGNAERLSSRHPNVKPLTGPTAHRFMAEYRAAIAIAQSQNSQLSKLARQQRVLGDEEIGS